MRKKNLSHPLMTICGLPVFYERNNPGANRGCFSFSKSSEKDIFMLHATSLAVKIPPRVILADSFGQEARICCPICGCKQVHMTAILSSDGTRNVELCPDLFLVQESRRRPDYPGSVSCTHFFCERGHEFRYLFRFSNRTTQVVVMASEFDLNDGFPRELQGD